MKYAGLWTTFPTLLVVVSAMKYLQFSATHLSDFISIGCLSFVPSLLIWSQNVVAKKNGKSDFSIIPTRTHLDPDYQSSARYRAQEKIVPEELLKKKPSGIVYGKSNGKYACIEPNLKGSSHTLILGSSGAGKTSSVIADTCLAASENKDSTSWLIVDIKGEILSKFISTTDRDADKLYVFNPRDRNGDGFDPFYDIDDSSEEYDILTSVRRVVFSLIPKKNNESSDSFWVDAPRAVLVALWVFGWQQLNLRTLPALADFALSKPLDELINDVLGKVGENSVVYKQLVSFGGEGAAKETLSGIAMNLANALSLVVSDEGLRFLLSENVRRITPECIEKEGVVVDIQISDQFLAEYSKILNLFLSTFLIAFTRRSEDSSPVIVLIDELGRIVIDSDGQLSGLEAVLMIGRSRKVSLILCTQSWDALRSAYSEAECNDMLVNLNYRVVLNAVPDDTSTVDMVVKGFGKYLERKRSFTDGKQQSSSYSFELQDVIRPDDLLKLPEQNRLVLLSPHGAFLIKKCPYYSDKYFKKIAENIANERRILK